MGQSGTWEMVHVALRWSYGAPSSGDVDDGWARSGLPFLAQLTLTLAAALGARGPLPLAESLFAAVEKIRGRGVLCCSLAHCIDAEGGRRAQETDLPVAVSGRSRWQQAATDVARRARANGSTANDASRSKENSVDLQG